MKPLERKAIEQAVKCLPLDYDIFNVTTIHFNLVEKLKEVLERKSEDDKVDLAEVLNLVQGLKNDISNALRRRSSEIRQQMEESQEWLTTLLEEKKKE